MRSTRGAKSIVRNFPPSRSSPAALFILSTVHLTLKCADDSSLFPPHFALALLLRAFPLSRLLDNLFFLLPLRSRGVAALFVTVNHRYPSPVDLFPHQAQQDSDARSYARAIRLLFSEKNIYIIYGNRGEEGKERERERELMRISVRNSCSILEDLQNFC